MLRGKERSKYRRARGELVDARIMPRLNLRKFKLAATDAGKHDARYRPFIHCMRRRGPEVSRLALTQVFFGSVFLGSLWVGFGGIASGLNPIPKSKGLLD